VAEQVNSGDKTPEEIEREMLVTRESLSEKVAALENQVVGTVQNAADTFTGTVEAVKSFVSQAPETVSETVKQASAAVSDAFKGTFDISEHVRKNPWTAVGISALMGGVVGALTASRSGSFSSLASSGAAPAGAPAQFAAAAPSRPGIMDEFMGMLGGKLKELAETAINSVSASVKSSIETAVPKLVDEAASTLTDREAFTQPPTIAARFDARRTQGS